MQTRFCRPNFSMVTENSMLRKTVTILLLFLLVLPVNASQPESRTILSSQLARKISHKRLNCSQAHSFSNISALNRSISALPFELDTLSITECGNYLKSIKGQISEPFDKDIVSAVTSYLYINSELYNIPEAEAGCIKLLSSNKQGRFQHLRFQAYLFDQPVYDAYIDVHVDKNKVVRLVNSTLRSISTVSNKIELSPLQAVSRTKKLPGAGMKRSVPEVKSTIYICTGGRARFAYHVNLALSEPLGDWEVIIDAESGAILEKINQMNLLTGYGSVYTLHPEKSKATIESLKYLTHPNLRGRYVIVRNDAGTDSYNEKGIHIHGSDSEHFNEPNMYYYLNTAHDYFISLGHEPVSVPTLAVVNLRNNPDSAYFSPLQQLLAFGSGEKFNDFAREAAVAYHEYSHAVLHSIVKIVYQGESGAINEGQADYFACSLTDSPEIGVWIASKQGKPYLRTLENNLIYPEDMNGKVHNDGQIWSGALWDLRKALGAGITDKLVYRSHHFLASRKPSFMDALNALLLADEDLYSGNHHQQIVSIMSQRGISPENYNGSVITGKEFNRLLLFNHLHDMGLRGSGN